MDDLFDPDGPGHGDNLFGLPNTADNALVQVIPVPWEATASYGRGTRGAPAAVLEASQQVDLHDLHFGDFWRAGIVLLPVEPGFEGWADAADSDAQAVIAAGGGLAAEAARVDAFGDRVHGAVLSRARQILAAGRMPAVLGGDHSSPYGLIQAVAEAHPGVGILHVDAHLDLRVAYLGFRWSHASIMHNALELPGVGRLVGVGYRDVGRAEVERVRAAPERIRAFFDHEVGAALSQGRAWASLCDEIVDALPPEVYVSIDIDGLDPALCPGTGTPVPGGLSWRDAQVLLARLSASRRVVGFDLCEVGTSEWDANVGARVLYKLAGCAVRSRGGGLPA